MSGEVVAAVEAIDQQIGHHTAHLTPWEQIQVAMEVIRRCSEMVEEIAEGEINPS